MKKDLKDFAVWLLCLAVIAYFYYQTPQGQQALDHASKGIMLDGPTR